MQHQLRQTEGLREVAYTNSELDNDDITSIIPYAVNHYSNQLSRETNSITVWILNDYRTKRHFATPYFIVIIFHTTKYVDLISSLVSVKRIYMSVIA